MESTDAVLCLVCGVNRDKKTADYCRADINGNLLVPIVAADWEHIWTSGGEARGLVK